MSDTAKPTSGKKTAGAFDVRVIIGSLLGLYGLLLTLMGIFGDPETEKTDGINANLWAGLSLLVIGGLFLLWWKMRPIVVPESEDHGEIGSRPDA